MNAALNAYVLHSRPWKETSLLLDVFSAELGNLRVAARGVKGKKRSPLTGLLQPFQLLSITVNRSHDYYYLQRADLQTPAPILKGNASLCALYCNELLQRLLPEQDPHLSIFAAYQQTLEQLSEGETLDPALRQFEWHLLNELGYAIDCVSTRDGQSVVAENYYRVHEDGVTLAASRDNTCFSGGALLAIANEQWRQSAREIKQIFRQLLSNHLGNKPLQSRELWLAKIRLQSLVESESKQTEMNREQPNDDHD